MGQALYRKYRSRSLEEIVGQEHITQTLQQALKQGRISHAYLFTGPRGVGKTSIARILAHQINGLTYTDDSPHMDIIEIDAASNRRIDEIRELREKVYVAPTSAKYKVYIIDEVHMLTREAFNALLKTLEEPPAHVVFILATTDAHKLPETIISRTQRFSFRPVESSKVAGQLKYIAQAEKLDVSDEALELLAKHGEGSFRDSISLLDQAAGQSGQVSATDIERLLGIPSEAAIEQLLALVATGSESAQLMQAISGLYDQGYQADEIAKRLGQALRKQLVNHQLGLEAKIILELLGDLVEVPASHDPEQALEIVLLRTSVTQLNAEQASLAVKKPKATTRPIAAEPTEPLPPPQAIAKAPAPAPAKAEPPNAQPLNIQLWPAVLKALKQQHNTLYSVVRMAQPDFSDDGNLKLAFAFKFHQKRLNENSNRQKLIDIIYKLTGQTVALESLVDKAAQPPQIIVEAETTTIDLPRSVDSDMSAISNIFGDAELLES